VTCKSKPGANSAVELSMSTVGFHTSDFPDHLKLTIDGVSQEFDASEDDDKMPPVEISAHPEDGVVTAMFDLRDPAKLFVDVSVYAKPATLKGGLDKETCKMNYTFEGKFSGSIYIPGDTAGGHTIEANDYDDTLDCTFYQSYGSAGC